MNREFRYHPDHHLFVIEVNDKDKSICSGIDATGKTFKEEVTKISRTKKRAVTNDFIEWFDKKVYNINVFK